MNIADRINVNIYDETFGSDHFPIHIEIDTQRLLYHKPTYKLKYFASIIKIKTKPNYVWNICKILKNSWVKVKHNSSTDQDTSKEKSIKCLNEIAPPWTKTISNKNGYTRAFGLYNDQPKELKNIKNLITKGVKLKNWIKKQA
ncbi:hypothetical protein TSAR_000969 [Trichomalopsis sarcophagae]|uniref:Endonuclease/exonuclease/phosphatase domain-containing protein n=1 Tax=Trichomalopsis sarcophagae TaxID=543379 RepID=A0A232EGF0_9HYME|nr:hypothetical protein TSAR_000969 [Trichomalopsis sarcophagae]